MKHLPIDDGWLAPTRSMFSVPHNRTYKSQTIHFGATYKELEWSWNDWLEEFEQILAKLYWSKVYLHLRAGVVGDYDYTYKALDLREQIYDKEPPHPATIWEFKGGPRIFDREKGPSGDENLTWIYENNVWHIKT